jgi:hypothetical protein
MRRSAVRYGKGEREGTRALLGPEAWFLLDGLRENPVLIGRLEEDPASHSRTQILESCFSSYSLLSRTIEGPVFVLLIRLLVP